MLECVLASTNKGKLLELRRLFEAAGAPIKLLSPPVPLPKVAETGQTYWENACLKAAAAAKATGKPALADDSGLEVTALNGAPGLYTARFAGPEATDEENNEYLLRKLMEVQATDRSAIFRCTLALVGPGVPGGKLRAEGVCAGEIALKPSGTDGFGYAPVFYVPQVGKTFSDLGEAKDRYSHRALAVRALTLALHATLQPTSWRAPAPVSPLPRA